MKVCSIFAKLNASQREKQSQINQEILHEFFLTRLQHLFTISQAELWSFE